MKPTVGELIAKSLADSAAHYLGEEPHLLRGDRDPEHIHRARTSTRRLRAVLRVAEDFADPLAVRSARSELGWLGGLLGAVRDSDVMAVRIRSLASDRQGRADGLLRYAVAAGKVPAKKLRSAMDTPRYGALRQTLGTFVDRTGERSGASRGKAGRGGGEQGTAAPVPIAWKRKGDVPAGRAITALAGKEWRSLSALATPAAKKASDPAALHAVRIQAKKCRYVAELATAYKPGEAKRFVERITSLQDILGEHHDVVVTRAWLASIAPGTRGLDADTIRSIDEVLFRETERLATEWRRAWKKTLDDHVDSWLVR